jgi:hypothetical protein
MATMLDASSTTLPSFELVAFITLLFFEPAAFVTLPSFKPIASAALPSFEPAASAYELFCIIIIVRLAKICLIFSSKVVASMY